MSAGGQSGAQFGGATAAGPWLKARRQTQDLTQEALAEQVGCSVETIKKIESGRLRPSRQLAELLAAALGLPAAHHPAFVRWVRSPPATPAPVASPAPAPPEEGPARLPIPPTALIGREAEVAAVAALLSAPGVRLVTLTGPGGSGKTRLALATAADRAPHYPDGVVFVPLAAIQDAALVLATIAATLGVREPEGGPGPGALAAYLREKALLLVLDNFEQVIPAAPAVADLLAGAPRLVVLVTSRAALHLQGEREFPVPPLAVPAGRDRPAGPVPAATVAEYPAIRLFVERAQAVRPEFALTDENAGAVVAICTRLQGLPLALELAAGRIRSLPPATLLARLDSSLAVLTGGARDLPARQQTLRATLAWSYDLLTPAERALLRRLAVFAGGAALEAAEAVCADPAGSTAGPDAALPAGAILDGLDSLVDKSLVRQQAGPAGAARFEMLVTVREYADEQLLAAGEATAVRDRHRDWFLDLAETAAPQLPGPAPGALLDRLEQERDNFRAALEWCAQRGAGPAELRLAAALAGFWHVRGYWAEGQMHLERALAHAGAAGDARRVAAAQQVLGVLCRRRGDYAGAATWLAAARAGFAVLDDAAGLCRVGIELGVLYEIQGREAEATASLTASLAGWRQLGDETGIAEALARLGHLAWSQGDYPSARAYLEESLVRRRALDDRPGIAASLASLALVVADEDDYATARHLHAESLALHREIGDKEGIARAMNALGVVARDQGDYPAARAYFEESLALQRELGAQRDVAMTLSDLGVVVTDSGDYPAARTILAESLALFRALGDQRNSGLVLTRLGWAELDCGRYAAARAIFAEGLALARLVGEKIGVARAVNNLGALALDTGDYPAARAWFAEGLTLAREQGVKWGIAWSLTNLGTLDLVEGHYATARPHLEEALAIRRDLGAPLFVAQLLNRLGILALAQGDRAAARAPLGESLALFRQVGVPQQAAEALVGWAALAQARGDAAQAARLLGAVARIIADLGIVLHMPEQPLYPQITAAARATLGEAAFAAAFAAGQALTWEAALASALEDAAAAAPG